MTRDHLADRGRPIPLSSRVQMLRAILTQFGRLGPAPPPSVRPASSAHLYSAGAETSGSAYGDVAAGVEPSQRLLLDRLFRLRCRFAAGEGDEHRVEPGRSYHLRAYRIEFGIWPPLAVIRSLELRHPTPHDFCRDRVQPDSELLLLSRHRAAAILISSDFDWADNKSESESRLAGEVPLAGVKGMKGGGGRRERAGRPPGSRNKRTRETVERVAAAATAGELEDVVVLLTKWANDPAKDDHFRAACAGKAAEFTHSKPSRLPERLPLPHEIPEWMLEDFEKRLKEDRARHPERYGLPRPKPKLVVGKKSRPPSDRWFAEISSTTDERRHKGGPKPWAPGERERLLQTPFHPDELERRQIYDRPNGEDPGS